MSENCAYCGGDLKPETITYPTNRDGRIVVVDNVPAFVCLQCGETVLEPDVVDKLHQIAWGEIPASRTVEVDAYDFARVA